jgi:fucose permease
LKSPYLVSLCHGGMICVAIVINLYPLYLTIFGVDFGGLNEEQLGRIPALMFAGIIFGIVVTGPLADRFGVRLFAVAGMAVSAVGLVLVALAQRYETLLLAGIVSGSGAGILDMSMGPLVAAVNTHRRTAALNRLHAYFCIGGILTVLAVSGGLHTGLSWRFMAGTLAIFPLLLLVAFAVVPLPALIHPQQSREGLRVLLRRPRFLLALTLMALAGATETGMMQWLPAYAELELGYSKFVGAFALILFSLGMAGGRLLTSYRLSHLRASTLLIISGIVSAVLLLCAGPFSTPAVALTACVLTGFGCSVLWPTCISDGANLFPLGGASLFAVLTAAGNIGSLAMPWIIGTVANASTLSIGVVSATGAPVFLTLLVLAAVAVEKRQRHHC